MIIIRRIRCKLKLFRVCHVCQNCIHANHDKGKKIYHWYRKGSNIGVDENDNLIEIPHEGYWNDYCEKKNKFVKWNKHKFCFKPQEWVIEHDKRTTRGGCSKP